jgi:hypothetical protein
MARLIMHAEATGGTGASSGVAKPGNRLPLYVVVSVSKTSGLPRTGLAATDFAIDALIVAPGGASVTISRSIEPQPGTYLIDIVPLPAAGTWMDGNYIFRVEAHNGNDHGQTLCQTPLA